MWTAASVLACALSLLGRSESSMPRIELIEAAPADVSFGAEAFVRTGGNTIYMITTTPVFRWAMSTQQPCAGESTPFLKLASVLAHEEWHIRNGPDEKRAYEHQLISLIRLGLPPGTGMFRDVQTSMLSVIEQRKRSARHTLLAQK